MSGGQDWAATLAPIIVSSCPCEKLRDAEERFIAAHTAAHYWLAELEAARAERDELRRRIEAANQQHPHGDGTGR